VNAFASGVEETYHAAVRQHLLSLCVSQKKKKKKQRNDDDKK
jgi:hypothetical protein